MSKEHIKKILTLVLGPIVPLTVAVFLLFPYLNTEKYEEIASAEDRILTDSVDVEMIGNDYETVREQAELFQNDIKKLGARIDSLKAANDSLQSEILAKQEEQENDNDDAEENPQLRAEDVEPKTDSLSKQLRENIKSLLSLEAENLAPILAQMTDKQVVQLYHGGNSLERKKLLRTLESKRAAKLMTEVMQ